MKKNEFVKGFYICIDDGCEKKPHLLIGNYAPDGTCEYEFLLAWSVVGGKDAIELRVYDDAWKCLVDMPELMSYLAQFEPDTLIPSIDTFAEQLKSIGFIELK